jgi:hypothetical protein
LCFYNLKETKRRFEKEYARKAQYMKLVTKKNKRDKTGYNWEEEVCTCGSMLLTMGKSKVG